MAVHVYLSVGTWGLDSGQFLDPITKQPTKEMRWRGELGPDDDMQGFKRKMQAGGHKVEYLAEKVGETREIDSVLGSKQTVTSYEME